MSTQRSIAEVLDQVKRGLLSAAEGRERCEALLRATAVAPTGGGNTPDIAVIGLACRFGDADSPSAFFRRVREGASDIIEVPAKRWDVAAHFDPSGQRNDRTYGKWGSFVPDIDAFDAAFFRINGVEARHMDPQQRLFLEECYRAIESAGQAPSRLAGSRCGVFVGAGNRDYEKLLGADAEAQAFWGNECSVLASRIAYVLDLRGPSLSVDTACSSSLVAIHLACQSLMTGESDLALAGGVFLGSTPQFYIWTSRAKMLSPTGRCHAFDHRANGFVPGEGVGVVVLKRLQDALRDGDPIRAVIRGTGVNQDGTTNGIIAPNLAAQRELAIDVYRRHGIDPRTLQYVEAHGTGTALGDPIEFRALSEAFRTFTEASRFCALGSVKANIGHASFAAGVAGFIKLVVALEQREMPPLAGFERENPAIDLNDSPFFINTTRLDWPENGAEPRRAALSSFGFSGTNAHVVLEEAPALAPLRRHDSAPLPFLLSAKTETALARRLRDLRDYVRTLPRDVGLADISRTLQEGRDHFAVRCAIVARDARELEQRLQDAISHAPNDAVWYSKSSSAAKSDGTNAAPERSLALAYVRGRDPATGTVSSAGRRVELPTYPFDKQTYWVDSQRARVSDVRTRPSETQVPLRLLLADPCIADHRVESVAVVAAALSTDLVLAAARGAFPDESFACEEVAWIRPLVVSGPEASATLTFRHRAERLEFAVTTSSGEEVTHALGRLVAMPRQPPPRLALSELKQRLAALWTDSRGQKGFYDAFQQRGIEYGVAFRTVHGLWANADEALAELRLTPALEPTSADYVIHPTLLDGALQATSALANATERLLPFAASRVEVFRPASRPSFAHIRRLGENSFDLSLCDAHGEVTAHVRGFALRAAPTTSNPPHGFYVPRWVGHANTAAASPPTGPILLVEESPRDSLLSGERLDATSLTHSQASAERLGELPRFKTVVYTATLADSTPDAEVLAWFRFIKALLASGYGTKPLDLFLVTQNAQRVAEAEGPSPQAAALIGLTQSLAKEYPHWRVRSVDLDRREVLSEARHPDLWNQVLAEPPHPRGEPVAHRNGRRYVRQLNQLDLPATEQSPFRRDGVYVIVGGAGGIGVELTRHLRANYGAHVLWLGRRAFDSTIGAQLAALDGPGTTRYLQADISDAGSIQAALREIKRAHSNVHGVFHSALVLRDQGLASMTEARLREALSPKVAGSVALAQAFADEALDFFCFFSSAQSFAGAAGQSNYAAGCTFQDAFAAWLQARAKWPVRVINWGFWGSVGVVATEDYRQRMARLGIGSLSPRESMENLERALSSGLAQVMSIRATLAPLREMGFEPEPTAHLDGNSRVPLIASVLADIDARSPLTLRSTVELHQEPSTRIEELALQGLAAAVRDFAWPSSADTALAAPELSARFGIAERHARLFRAALTMLVEAQFLEEPSAQHFRRTRHTGQPRFDVEQSANDLAARFPKYAAEVTLLKTCLVALPEVLTGRIAATEVLFPGASMHLVEGIYRGNPVSDVCNERVADTVEAYVRRAAGLGRTIDILEIGAGTGGTSAVVLERLKPFSQHVRYVYTDISRRFLLHAEDAYRARYPYIELRTFDVERPLHDQGFGESEFDLVIATNVLHATRRIENTLRQAKAVLRRHGLLVLNEITRVRHFGTLTFGLLDGWWLHDDAEYRLPASPALSLEAWSAALRVAGFESPRALDREGASLGQHVIVAASDGVAYQPRRAELEQAAPVQAAAPVDETPRVRAIEQVPELPLVSPAVPVEPPARPRLLELLCTRLAQLLQVDVARITEAATWDEFGLDSILVVKLTAGLEETFGRLPKTLFFEHRSVGALADFLLTQGVSVPRAPEGAREGDPRREQRIPGSLDIAIIGVAGRYPEAPELATFWNNLKTGRDSVSDTPPERVGKREHRRSGGFIDGADCFDAWFFQISPREAELIDPQERLFLEVAWHTLEDAGYTRKSCRRGDGSGNVGVFVGVMYEEYQLYGAERTLLGEPLSLSGSPASVANRVSYFCDFSGPSLAVDTQCSSSLVAIHLACRSLRSGECRMALAGGVNLSLHSNKYIKLEQDRFLSSRGRCESFGASGDGFVPSEGVGCVLLKPLEAALADGDHIYGVIRGSAINHGGRTHGYTVPNPRAQAAVVAKALDEARVPARDISYLEAHGTGTALGDPIEIAGLSQAFAETNDRQFCSIGSVKSNIGHAESAAGVAGVTKVLLQMQHRSLVPSLHAEQTNPHIDFAASPFRVQRELTPWNPERGLRIAGVSSFGAGGANAHLVIEEAPPREEFPASPGPHLFLLSARDDDRLRAYAERLLAYLESERAASERLDDIAYTLQVGREHFEARLAFFAGERTQAAQRLRDFLAPRASESSWSSRTSAEALLQAESQAQASLTDKAARWIRGEAIDWETLGGASRRRASLPTYPFEPARYWVPEAKGALGGNELPRVEKLHPLLDRNVSDGAEQRYAKRISAEDRIVADHRLAGDPVLPAGAYLEMARAAGELASQRNVTRLIANSWRRPLALNGHPLDVCVVLRTGGDVAEYEIVSSSPHDEARVHASGRLEFTPNDAPPSPSLDLAAIRARCGNASDVAVMYRRFEALGLHYGESFRVLKSLASGVHEAVARIEVTPEPNEAGARLSLNPRVLDGALQATAGVAAVEESSFAPVPVAMSEVIVYASTPLRAWAWVRKRDEASAEASLTQTYDVTICDESGRLCAEIRELVCKLVPLARSLGVRADAKPSTRLAEPMPLPAWCAEYAAGEPAMTLEELGCDALRIAALSAWVESHGARPLPRIDTQTTLQELWSMTQREPEAPLAPEPAESASSLVDAVANFARPLLASVLKLPERRIERGTSFEQYGLDSVRALELVTRFEQTFGPLPKTLLFECRTLEELAKHLVDRAPERARSLCKGAELPLEAPRHVVPEPKSRQLFAGRETSLDIAVVAVAGRYPEAESLEQFWENLRNGRDSVHEIPPQRWARERVGDSSGRARWGAFLDDPYRFDPLFFEISPKEAERMDPQERLFLEVCWEALERAGSTRARRAAIAGDVGVFVGVMYDEYQLLGAEQSLEGSPTAVGGVSASIANRVSHVLDLRGPSLAINSMCSSSLVAIHLACRSLRSGECRMALAGGVNLSLHPNKYVQLSQYGFLSSRGRCESFGASGDGYVPSEGVGCVLLKPLEAALADGDHIYGVIRGSAINHGGRTHGYTVPSPPAQAAVVAKALDEAGVPARDVSYIEAHGTGTALGDPIEIAGLSQAFAGANDRQFCSIGSVKSNIGHAESAAGVAGVTKVLLQMQHRLLVPSLHAEQTNPHIDFAASPFRVQRELAPWSPERGSRIAGVSSFGAGGANAHLVIEEAPARSELPPSPGPHLLLLSARDDDRLRAYAERFLAYLESDQAESERLDDVAYTLQVGREHFEARLAFFASDKSHAAQRVRDFLLGQQQADAMWCSRDSRDSQQLAQLTDDEDGRALIARWFERGKLDRLAEFWASGGSLDWAHTQRTGNPRIITLPTYPFAAEQYRILGATHHEARPPIPAARTGEFLLLTPRWQRSALPAASAMYPNTTVAWLDDGSPFCAALRARFGDLPTVRLPFDSGSLAQRLERAVSGLVELVAHSLQKRGTEKLRLLVVAPLADDGAYLATLAGVLRSAQRENPAFLGKLLLIAASEMDRLAWPELWRDEASLQTHEDVEVRYVDGQREVRRLGRSSEGTPGADLLAPGGSYWVTGGLGGLGLVFARKLCELGNARVALSGRRSIDGAQQAELSALAERTGSQLFYVQADISQLRDTEQAYRTILSRFGRLDGVIHSAGVLRDSFLLRKTPAEVSAVLGPKLAGALNLDEVTREADLKFLVLFSSLAGLLGNVGQADYASANRFLDAFAEARAVRVQRGERHGKTLSIVWPLWRDGGMRLPAQAERALEAETGLRALDNESGFEAFRRALSCFDAVVAVAAGNRAQLERTFLDSVDSKASASNEPWLRELIAEELKISPARILPHKNMWEYGLDSMALTRLQAKLSAAVPGVSPSALLEHPTLHALHAHVVAVGGSLQKPEPAPARALATPSNAVERVAVVGVSGRYPGASDLRSLWQQLNAERSAIREVPRERWDAAVYYDADKEAAHEGSIYCRRGAFIDDVDQFDCGLFHVSPAEAKLMTPEERLLLQSTWATLEDAGLAKSTLAGRRVGVFLGITTNTYGLLGSPRSASIFDMANRVSHAFGWTGPSVAVDSACASSHLAVHLACESIARSECEAALVGGVNLYLHPAKYVALCQGRLLSTRDVSRPFSKGGDGFVPGEGVGTLLLVRDSFARQSRQRIYGYVVATGTAHKGGAGAYHLPHPPSQAELMRAVLGRASLVPSDISYIEAQAFGAELVDVAEWRSLAEVYQRARVGSIKGHLGHLEGSAGVAQLTKVLLQLQHAKLAPTLTGAPWADGIVEHSEGLAIQTQASPWEEAPRRAAINAFGAGGSLVHLVVEEAGPSPRPPELDQEELVVLSAPSEAQLDRALAALKHELEASAPRLCDVAYTLQVGREPFPHRWACIANSTAALLQALAQRRGSGSSPQSFRAVAELTNDYTAPTAKQSLRDLAEQWVRGAHIDWERRWEHRNPVRISLPVHPFETRRCWVESSAARTRAETPSTSVASYYDSITPTADAGVAAHLVFAPFPERVPGFSWLLTSFAVGEHAHRADLVRQRQAEMKRLLLQWAGANSARRILDFGCGLGTDLGALAAHNPELEAVGYTLSPAQCRHARARLQREGLAERVRIQCADSAKQPFPGTFEVAIGFEVTFHVEDKTGLFRNLAEHLVPGGRLVLADVLANLASGVASRELGQFTATPREMAELLASHGFVIQAAQNASRAIANYLHDPSFEEHLALLHETHPEQAGGDAVHRGWHRFGEALELGLFSYVLLLAAKDDRGSVAERLAQNLRALETAPEYALATAPAPPEAPRETARPAERPRGGSTADVERELGRLLATRLELRADELDPGAAFSDLGLNSLLALRWVADMQRELRIPIKVEDLFAHSTIRDLSAFVTREYGIPETLPPPAPQPAPLAKGPAPTPAIAIIGMSGRFPGAANVREFWRNLEAGIDSIGEVPETRWDVAKHYSPDVRAPGKSYSKWGGFLDDIESFEPRFFRISPADAELMDPQQRLFLMESVRALEDAAQAPRTLAGKSVGVCVGVMGALTHTSSQPDDTRAASWMLGNANSILAARIAYHLDLKGPALSVDTACSSSLLAVHLASKMLRDGEVDMAIAGGVSLFPGEAPFVMMSKAGMLSPTGRCRPFAQAADGTTVGEAVGVVVLKRLSDALADGDPIHGVIEASGVNQDGRTNGITAPNGDAQAALQRRVYREAGIDPRSISYVEAHGTGTRLGDPVEVSALTQSFRDFTQEASFCAIGSVKGNVGHTAAAAGVVGLIKLLLALRYERLPKTLHVEPENELIDFGASPFTPLREARQWPRRRAETRRAALNSFGFSGTNVHLVLAEPPVAANDLPRERSATPELVPLSAHSDAALTLRAQQLLEHLSTPDGEQTPFAGLVSTLQTGRDELEERLAIVASDATELREALRAYCAQSSPRVPTFRGTARGARSEAPASNASVTDLAEHWSQGGTVRFTRRARRVPLPTYPFPTRVAAQLSARVTPPRPVDDLLFRPEWRPAPPVAHGSVEGPAWVVAPRALAGLAEALVAQHAQRAAVHMVPLEEQRDWDRAFGALPPPRTIYFLAATAPDFEAQFRSGSADTDWSPHVDRTVRALFHMLQALQRRGSLAGTALLVVTQNANRVFGGEALDPFAAAVSGLTRSFAKECPAASIGIVDVALEDVVARTLPLAQELEREAAAKPARDVALRGTERYVRRLVRADATPVAPSALRQGGTYLIVGGTGGIGRLLAAHLRRAHHARVALLSRTALTPSELAELDRESQGLGEVLHVAADVADPRALQSALSQVDARWGALHGVFHSAMYFDETRVADMSEATLDRALRPKLQGVLTLAQALRSLPLDFLILFSSGQVFSGNAGRSHYGAACSFEDAAAIALRGILPYPVSVIDWGFWNLRDIDPETWRPTPGGREKMEAWIHAQGSRSIDPSEGCALIEHVASEGREQVAVFKGEPWMLRLLGVVEPKAGPSVEATAPSTLGRKRATHQKFTAARSDLTATLEAFRELGALAAKELGGVVAHMDPSLSGDSGSFHGLAERLRVAPSQRRIAKAIEGILGRSGNPAGRAGTSDERAFERFVLQHPTAAPQARLLEACLARLPEILRGEVSATEVMFKGGSLELVQETYRGNAVSDWCNDLTANVVSDRVEELLAWAPERPVRVLEVGAGTGGTSRAVLRKLARFAPRIRYAYTDVSRAFLLRAEEEFREYASFVDYRLLDVENEPRSQGFEVGGFDIVLGANVLHATRNIRSTLLRLKSVLTRHGWLVVNETTTLNEFLRLTFGLLDGWWLFEDVEQRLPDAPLLSAAQWSRALSRAGFEAAPPLGLDEIPQHVFVAESDGRLEQIAAAPAPSAPERREVAVPRRRDVAVPSNLRSGLLEVLGQVLKVPPSEVDPELPFLDLGVDSISATEIVERLRTRFRIELKTTDLFKFATVSALLPELAARIESAPALSAAAPPAENGLLGLLASLRAGDVGLDEALRRLEPK